MPVFFCCYLYRVDFVSCFTGLLMKRSTCLYATKERLKFINEVLTKVEDLHSCYFNKAVLNSKCTNVFYLLVIFSLSCQSSKYYFPNKRKLLKLCNAVLFLLSAVKLYVVIFLIVLNCLS